MSWTEGRPDRDGFTIRPQEVDVRPIDESILDDPQSRHQVPGENYPFLLGLAGTEGGNEFVFKAYHHRPDAIFLTGLPDVLGSLPHSI